MASTSYCLLFLFLFCVRVITANDFALEGEEFSLTCVADTESSEVLYWLIHGEGDAFIPGTEYDSITVEKDGTLTFKRVAISHEGQHLCVTRSENKVTGQFVKMNVRPLPSMDLWNDVYKNQFLTGLIAAVMCAIIFAAGCLVFKYRYREPQPALLKGSYEEEGHVNPALEVEVAPPVGNNTKL